MPFSYSSVIHSCGIELDAQFLTPVRIRKHQTSDNGFLDKLILQVDALHEDESLEIL